MNSNISNNRISKSFFIIVQIILFNAVISASNDSTRFYLAEFHKLIDTKPDSALVFAEKAQRIYAQFKNDTGIAQCQNLIGKAYKSKADNVLALEYFTRSLDLYKNLSHAEGISINYLNIGHIYDYNGKYDEAVEYFIKAIKVAEAAGIYSTLAAANSNIGVIYKIQGNDEKALQYYYKAFEYDSLINDSIGLAADFNNIGNVYESKKDYNKSIEYYKKTLHICRNMNHSYGIAFSLNNIGAVHYILKQFDEALNYFNQSLEIREKINDQDGISTLMRNIGALYKQEKDYPTALMYFEKALYHDKELYYIKDTYKEMSDVYALMGDYKSSLNFQLKYSQIKDSLFNQNNSDKIAELEATYQNEKKQLEIENLQKEGALKDAEVKRQNIQKIAFASGFGLTIILVLVIFKGYRNKQKAHKIIIDQKLEVERQKSEADYQKELVEEKNKDITDSINYARNIQQAMLPFENRMKKAMPEHFVVFKPKDIVSGDFYWFVEKDEKIFLSVVDCTGHGVPGAFMSMIGSAILSHIVGEQNITRADLILNEMHRQVRVALKQEDTNNKDGMDLVLCVIDKKNEQLEFAGAMNPLYVVKTGAMETIKGDKTSIGGSQDEEDRIFTLHTLAINETLTIYLSTDGFADQFGGPRGKKFKYAQLKELLLANADKSMAEQREILDKVFEEWKGDLEQVDDVCVIGVSV